MCKDKLLLAQILSYNSLFVTFRVSIHLNKICFCPLFYDFLQLHCSVHSIHPFLVYLASQWTKRAVILYIYIHNIHSHLVILIKKGQIWIEIREIVFNLEVLSYTHIHTHLLHLICCKKGIFCWKIDHCDEY